MSEIAVDHGLLRQVAYDVQVTKAAVHAVGAQVATVEAEVRETEMRLIRLRQFVEDMRREQRNAAALQRAITEIIRVRQELEQKFGKYQLVRDTMMGIITATDSALVTKDTISRVSEELMVGTPNYWLAPCVVALAAWIANDRDLANRAVKEADRRDKYKTALLMALVCRRNKKYEASKKWLTYYFETQDATNISRSVLLFVNAYANGIFDANGEQCDSQGDEFIREKWLPSLEQSNPNFAKEQDAYWTGRFCQKENQCIAQTVAEYPVLAKCASKQEFAGAIAYLERINASALIAEELSEIIDYKVDTKVIEEQIEEYLKGLITDFDEAEFDLREEEAQYTAIKQANGDVDVANAYIKRKKAKKALLAKKVSLIKYLNDTITGNRVDELDLTGKKPEEIARLKANHEAEIKSEKKLALKFTKTYVHNSYEKFMNANAPLYPNQMKATVEGIEHSVETQEDKKSFIDKVRSLLTGKREAEIAAVKPGQVIAGGVIAVIGLIPFIAGAASCAADSGGAGGVGVFVGVGMVGLGLLLLLTGRAGMKKKKSNIASAYDARFSNAVKLIEAATAERAKMNLRKNTFENSEKFDIREKI